MNVGDVRGCRKCRSFYRILEIVISKDAEVKARGGRDSAIKARA